MGSQNPEASFLGIPRELRESIYEHILPTKKLYKQPFHIHNTAINHVKIYRRLKNIELPLLIVNKQIYFEALPVFQRIGRFHIHRFGQLRSSVYGSEAGVSDQFRHLTVHGDRGDDKHETLLIKLSDWVNLRYLAIPRPYFDDLLSNVAIAEPVKTSTSRNTRSKAQNVTKMQQKATNIEANLPHMAELFAQLLSYNDGCLRISSQGFFDTFQVYGRKGKITPQNVREFITKLQPECTRAAMSRRCFHAPVEVMIGDIKVSIGYTMTGITTARIL